MKFPKGWLVWVLFAICATTILAAMTWQTKGAMDAERQRADAETRADLQERMRLALWRMDTLGATIFVSLNQESPEEADRTLIRKRFFWGSGSTDDLPDSLVDDPTGCVAVISKLQEQRPEIEEPSDELMQVEKGPRSSEVQQKAANNQEWLSRGKSLDNALDRNRLQSMDSIASPRALWRKNDLFMFAILSKQPPLLNGLWLDSAALETRLLAEVKDLLPNADLIPAESRSDDGLVLASFPMRLKPGALSTAAPGFSLPIAVSLVAGWLAVLVAIVAASGLVVGIMLLSERRASFVSAVTHELRTPLTTFRLYSDMLESGAVKPEKQGTYLRVLSREADRLSHLVENVLAFSRIERGSARTAVMETTATRLLESMRERLESRLSAANLELDMSLIGEAATLPIRSDSTAIEHILFNLIDNAAKYAATSDPAKVEIGVERSGGKLRISVRDHGPGVQASERRRIFRAFHKSARAAAETCPGVGLGLALSRRLAREMGGDLVCSGKDGGGACFVLTIPVH